MRPTSTFRRAITRQSAWGGVSKRSRWEKAKEWHPFAAIVGTAGVFMTFVVPIYTAKQADEIATMKARIQTMEVAQATSQSVNASYKALQEELTGVKRQLRDANRASPLKGMSPYPNDLGAVVVGSPFAKVSQIFPNFVPEGDPKRPASIAVTTKNPIFTSAIFLPTKYDKNNSATVRAVVFEYARDSSVRDTLRNHLNQALGFKPEVSDGSETWKTKAATIVLDMGYLKVQRPSGKP